MLDRLRNASTGLLGRLVIAALVVALGFFGTQSIFGGAGNIVASVAGEEITAQQFQVRYQAAARQYGGRVPAELPQSVLYQLVSSAVLDAEVRKLGLAISEQELGRAIQANDLFANRGVFDRLAYDNIVRTYWGSEAAFLAEWGPQEVRAQLLETLAAPLVDLPNAYLRIPYQFEGERRDLRYVTLTEATLGEIPEPTEEQITAYYTANPNNWNAPETRTALVLSLTRTGLAEPDILTEEELRAVYLDRQNQFGDPETRHIWQQVLSADRANAVQALLDAGQTYEQLIAANEIAPNDVGTVPASFFTANRAIADAAFSLEAGDTVIVQGAIGRTLVHVSEINPAVIPPFEEVEAELRQTVAEEQAVERIASLREEVEDRRGGGASLTEISAAIGVPLQTVTIDQAGNDGLGEPIPDLPGGQALATGMFNSDVGLADAPIDLRNTGVVWYEVTEVTPPHQLPVEDVRERVIEQWHAAQVRTGLQDLSNSIQRRVRAGEDIAAVAAELGLDLGLAEGITRVSSANETLSSQAILSAFNGPEGLVVPAPTPDGLGVLVIEVAAVDVPEIPEDADPTPQMIETATAWENDLVGAYVNDLLGRAGDIRQYPNLINQITGIVP